MDILEKILEKCENNNLTFLGFVTENGEYKNHRTKLRLKCNKCGYEWDTTSYDKFIKRVSKCLVCTKRKSYSVEDFEREIIKRCDELDYTFLGFVDNKNITRHSKIKIKCNKCNEIWSTTAITNFIRAGRTSHKCGRKNPIQKLKNIRNMDLTINKIKNKVDGSSLEFIRIIEGDNTTVSSCHVELFCKKCGATNIISYRGLINSKNVRCRKCEFSRKIEDGDARNRVIEKCKIMDYEFLGFDTENGKYDGKRTKLILKCNKCGRLWKTTGYLPFVNGVVKCMGCAHKWKLEEEVRYILKKYNIEYIEQKTFVWLKYNGKLRLDFFLPQYNAFIECQGRQHFIPVDAFGGENGFKETEKRDDVKYRKCIENNITPIYFSDKKWDYFNGEKTVKNENELIKKIFYG